MAYETVQHLPRISRFSRDIGHVASHRKHEPEHFAPVGGHGMREVDGSGVAFEGP